MANLDVGRLRVLVADGNEHTIGIIRSMLRGFGIRQFFEATDAIKALEILRRSEVDIALIGLNLKEVDGLEMTRLIRFAPDSRSPRMPIILMTAGAERSTVEAGISAGVDEVLAIPVSAKKLIERIVRRLENPRTYVRFGSYFGPDRRRRVDDDFAGPDRRRRS